MSQSHADIFLLLLSSRSRSQQGVIWSKYDSFYYLIWTVDTLATKLGLMKHYQKPECPMKKNGLLHSGSRSLKGKTLCLSSWYLLHHQTFCFQTCYCDSSLWVRVSCKKIDLQFQGQGHCMSSSDKNMTIPTVSFELLILMLPNLVW